MSSGGTTWNFTYDANGMRTQRTDGTTTYSYVYNGGQLSQMKVGETTLNFTYDASGTPLSVNYNGTYYYYVTDLQGDVVAIVDTEGEKVVEYLYDAWGRLLKTSGTKAADLGLHNPLRYRGYVYDPESGLYYLQSRYYNPELGRFINADAFTSTGQGILGNNMFAYCKNNPVICADSNGGWINVVIGALAGAVSNMLSTAANIMLEDGQMDAFEPEEVVQIFTSGVIGAISGAIAATGVGGVGYQALMGGVCSFADSAVQNYVSYMSGDISASEAIVCTLVDTSVGALFGAMGAEGTGNFDYSNKVTKEGLNAFRKLKGDGLHPVVKAGYEAAKCTLGKYVGKEIGSAFSESLGSGVIAFGVSGIAGTIAAAYS